MDQVIPRREPLRSPGSKHEILRSD